MARTKKNAEPVTIDIVDLITAKLDEMEGISVTQDAWKNKAPEEYGVIEMDEEPMQISADGHVIDENYRLTLTLYVNGSSDAWADNVREKLDELESAYEWLDIGCRMIMHQFVFSIGKVRWAFRLTVPGPLIRTVT
jgi:hypothetical protein